MATKRFDPMILLIVVLVLFVALAVAAQVVLGKIDQERADNLAAEQQIVRDENERIDQEWEITKEEYLASINGDSANKAWPAAASQGWDVIDLTTYPLESPYNRTVSRSDAMFGGLLLVNEWHSRPEDFDESMMVSLNSYVRGANTGLESFWDDASCKLHPVAIDALVEMLLDAKAEGYDHYVVKKGYNFRTFEDQQTRFNAELDRQRTSRPNMADEELIARARKNVNYPGTSEFNSGLSFCLYLYEGEEGEIKQYYKDTPFYDTPDGQWLLENAWRYGFVFRFPTNNFPTASTVDKAYKTGMNQSLNCYRYVGKAHAAVMNHLDLCLEEYLEYLKDHPHIAVFENGRKRYEIVYQEVGDNVASFSVTTNGSRNNVTMSLDNWGGVVTVHEY